MTCVRPLKKNIPASAVDGRLAACEHRMEIWPTKTRIVVIVGITEAVHEPLARMGPNDMPSVRSEPKPRSCLEQSAHQV